MMGHIFRCFSGILPIFEVIFAYLSGGLIKETMNNPTQSNIIYTTVVMLIFIVLLVNRVIIICKKVKELKD
jgi:hypothetical protein